MSFNENRRFNNELSEFNHNNCRKDMTILDIDTVQWKSNIIRFIESKHMNEPIRKMQGKFLKLIATCLSVIGFNIEVLVIRGDMPYTDGVIIFDMKSGNQYELKTKEELISFLDFKTPLNKLYCPMDDEYFKV